MKTIEQLEAEIKERQEQIEALKREADWYPKDGERVYRLHQDGSVLQQSFRRYSLDAGLFDQGNIARTREELEFIRNERALQAKLRKLANGWKPDWSDTEQSKWFVCFSVGGKPEVLFASWSRQIGEVYFPTREAAEAALQATRDDWIKLYGCDR